MSKVHSHLWLIAIGLTTALASAGSATAQDLMTIATATARSGATAQIPLFLRDVSGTSLDVDKVGSRVQGVAFKVTAAPPDAIASVAFARDGVLGGLVPLYEKQLVAAGTLTYFAIFEEGAAPVPLTLGALEPGDRLGTISLTFATTAIAGTTVTLTLDPTATLLSNQGGTTVERVSNSNLALSSGSASIEGAATTTTLSSSRNPAEPGQSVTITAAVTSTAAGQITGTVRFSEGETVLATATLANSTAAWTSSGLTQGTHLIVAAFSGDPSYLPSSSVALSQVMESFGAPTNVVADATSSTSVTLSWNSVAGAVSYDVSRASDGGGYQVVGSTTAPQLNQTGLTPETAYVYRVRAVNGSGNLSADSPPSLATTVTFTDDPIVAGQTLIKAIHMSEMKAAVNAVRRTARLQPFTFTIAPQPGQPIAAAQTEQLRDALAAALPILGVVAPAFAEPALTGLPIRAVNIQQLRDAVR